MNKLHNALLALTALVSSTVAQENYSQWTGQRSYYLSTTATGANVPTTVRNFPLLVRLGVADSAVFSAAKAGGADLRFAKSSGVRLQHQIESWNATTRAAAIWVRVDTILGNTQNQIVRMYWGKADAVDSSKATAVFDTTNGYVAVWHMTGSANDTDVTTNKFPAIAVTDSIPTAATGLIGAGRALNGSAQHFTVPHHEKLNITEQITMSAWVNATAWTGSARILQKGSGTSSNAAQYGFRDNSSDNFAIEINSTHAATAPSPATGVWHLIQGTYDGSTITNYQDGVAVATATNVSGAINTGSEAIKIGRSPLATAANLFNGILDEVRLQKVARSADWVKLEYESQRADQTLMKLTPTAIRAGSAGSVGASFGVSTSAAGVTFSLPNGTGRVMLTVADMRGKVLWSREANLGSTVSWSGKGLPAGTYVARVTIQEGTQASRAFQKNFVLAH